ncbi:O-antigen ligase family protein [Microvirga sp. M2]|uniref:O-antigen ligase family protein n=1 Tax=Microvirga sp. M2 TaxID=3073270 RepID=UPI0039C0FEF5
MVRQRWFWLPGLGLCAHVLGPRRVLAVVIGLVAVWMLIQPVFGRIVDAVPPTQMIEWMASVHSRVRLDIWKSFGALVEHGLLMGTGLGTTSRLGRDPVTPEIAQELPQLLAAGHPHDNLLQIWAELGAASVVLFLALCTWVAGRLSRGAPDLLPERLALLGSAVSIALVSHGAWQDGGSPPSGSAPFFPSPLTATALGIPSVRTPNGSQAGASYDWRWALHEEGPRCQKLTSSTSLHRLHRAPGPPGRTNELFDRSTGHRTEVLIWDYPSMVAPAERNQFH